MFWVFLVLRSKNTPLNLDFLYFLVITANFEGQQTFYRQRAFNLRLFTRLHCYDRFCFIFSCLVNGLACYPTLCGNNSCLCAANIFTTPCHMPHGSCPVPCAPCPSTRLLPTPVDGIKFYFTQNRAGFLICLRLLPWPTLLALTGAHAVVFK